MWLIALMLACLASASDPLAAGAPTPVAVSIGVTRLLEDPACTVGYQLFEKASRSLGWRWTGVDGESGTQFGPHKDASGRYQVFMHCPWRQGPGIAYADFSLLLPRTSRIRLNLQTSLRPPAPGSDGVLYRVRVEGQPVWENLCQWRDWRDFQVDLSRFSGRVVTLRLEVDPGAARNTTDDWSLWGNVEIHAGSDAEIAAARVRQEQEREQRRVQEIRRTSTHADADLSPFTRADVNTARPSTAGPVRNSVAAYGRIYALRCEARDEMVEYRFDTERGLLAGLQVWVGGKLLDPSPFQGGPKVVFDGREYSPTSPELRHRLVAVEGDSRQVVCQYEYQVAGSDETATLTARVSVEGKSLVLSLQGEPNRFAGFVAKPQGGPEAWMEFVSGSVPIYHRQGFYCTSFPDMWQSDSAGFGGFGRQWETRYSPLTDGSRRTLRDTFYLTVSSRWEETLANTPHPPSPFLDDLSQRVVLDLWGGSFAETEQTLRDLARYGVDRCLVIKHVWQRDGYDRTFPNVMPANASQGGDAGLRRLSQTARELGHRFCVHENFYDFYPNAEAFRQEDCAVKPDGKPIPGWYNGSVRALILKPSRLMEYARTFSTDLAKRYAVNAAYHDIMPTWHVDYDARVPGSGIMRRTHEYTAELCRFNRELYGGPVVFEAIGPPLAGLFDGGCNHGTDTGRTPPSPAYELLKTHGKMSNHGFGYYERWLPWGYGPGWSSYVMTDRELDRYRATQIAFGRTGFIGQQLLRHPHALAREYHLMQAFGRAYTGKEIRKLAYQVDGAGWVDAGTAARFGEWGRQRAVYDGGQEVYVNLTDKPWNVGKMTLPAHAAATIGPRATAYTAVMDGQIADYASYEGTLYADARSHQWLPAKTHEPITPRLGPWKDNGDGTFDLTVQWEVGRALDRDLRVFWHFLDKKILFQNDHAPKVPTTRWRVGKTVADGPFRIKVPTDQSQTQYDLAVGLYDKQGRALLVNEANQLRIATLHLTRSGDRVTKVELRPVSLASQPGLAPEPYLEGANRARKVLDFGTVATNGAVLLRSVPEGRELVPVPIGEKMRVGLIGSVRRVTPVTATGTPLADLPTRTEGGKTWFEVPAEAAKLLIR